MQALRRLRQRGSSPLVPVLLGLVLALGAIAVFQKAAGWDEPCGRTWSRSVHAGDDTTRVTLRSGRCRLEAKIRGDVRLDPPGDDIAHLGPGARLEIEHKEQSEDGTLVLHELTARPGPTPETPDVVYSRDGTEGPLDAEGREWLQRVALELYRRVGIDAEARSRRIWNEGGAEALLAEVESIGSDHLAARYLGPILRHGDAGDLADAFVLAQRRIGSDLALANLLTSLARADRWAAILPQADPRFARVSGETVAEIGSDYEQRRALTALLDSLPTDGSAAELENAFFAAAAGTMGSDYEAAELIVSQSRRLAEGRSLPPATLLLLDEMGSDYELRRALQALVEHRPPGPDLLSLIRLAERRIGSDYELAELLLAVLDSRPSDAAVEDAVRHALVSVGSQHERNRVLERLDG